MGLELPSHPLTLLSSLRHYPAIPGLSLIPLALFLGVSLPLVSVARRGTSRSSITISCLKTSLFRVLGGTCPPGSRVLLGPQSFVQNLGQNGKTPCLGSNSALHVRGGLCVSSPALCPCGQKSQMCSRRRPTGASLHAGLASRCRGPKQTRGVTSIVLCLGHVLHLVLILKMGLKPHRIARGAYACLLSHPVVSCQAPLSMEFSRQGYWSGLQFPTLVDLPDPGTEPTSPESPALAGEFFATEPPGKPARGAEPSIAVSTLYFFFLFFFLVECSLLHRWAQGSLLLPRTPTNICENLLYPMCTCPNPPAQIP